MIPALVITELLEHLDTLVESLPEPDRGRRNLPEDLVVLQTMEEKLSGVGRLTETAVPTPKQEQQGTLAAHLEILLWAHDAADVVDRSRQLIALVMALGNQTTEHGRILGVRLVAGSHPSYIEELRGWRAGVGLNVDFEYLTSTEPGVGVIEEVPVNLQGELAESFTIPGD